MVDRPAGQDGFEIVPLKYADVSEVAGLLTQGLTIKSNDAFAPQEPAFGSSSSVHAGAGPPPAQSDASADSVGQSLGDAVAIDRRLNAIILKGSPERIAALKALIARIDLPLRSVLLEMAFVDLDESAANSLGLDFNNTNSQLGVATFQSGGYLPAGAPAGRTLTSVSLQGAIAAQVQSGHGRIINKPRIAAQSGSTAKLITGDALPILTSATLPGVSGVSQQVQYVNVGVTLQIAPRVSEDGYVTSKVFCVVSSVTGTSKGYPTISQQEAQTSATVRDGDTFVIGGLSQQSDTATYTKLPGAGQTPLVGGGLNQSATTRSRSELYIVVTPHIVKPWEPGASKDVASH